MIKGNVICMPRKDMINSFVNSIYNAPTGRIKSDPNICAKVLWIALIMPDFMRMFESFLCCIKRLEFVLKLFWVAALPVDMRKASVINRKRLSERVRNCFACSYSRSCIFNFIERNRRIGRNVTHRW